MKLLPRITQARINSGKTVVGSFIDAEWVLHYIEYGRWEFQIGPRRHVVGPGDMVLTPPRCLHVVRVVAGKRLAQHVVHFELNDPRLRRAGLAHVATLPEAVRDDVLRLNDRVRQEWRHHREQAGLIVSGYLVAMLGIYLRHSLDAETTDASTDPHWQNIENAVRFIQTHHQDKTINLARISAAAALSPNYFCTVFRTGTGIPVRKYLLAYRLERAEELLLHSRLNCSEIADAVGLADVHLLSRVFKRHKQLAPTLYRARYGGP